MSARHALARALRKGWTWPAALVAVAAVAALSAAVATGRLPLADALSLALALIGA